MDAPRQDWKLYQERVRPAHAKWLRSLTYDQSFDLFRSMARLAAAFPNPPEEMERINRRRERASAFRAMSQP